MDAIFEENSEEVGSEIEAYCPSPRCKADTTHTIISMYEDEIRRVQCVVCGEVHAYRKPRGDAMEEGADPAKAAPSKKLGWDEALARSTETELAACRPYSIRDTYELGDVVHHPMFDVGFVVELLPDNKVDVVFRTAGSRILVHNRGDLASRMPEISEIPIPREAKKKKRSKKPEIVEDTVVVKTKADIDAAVSRARAAAQNRMDAAQEAAEERNKRLKAEAKAAKAAAKAAKSGKVPAPVVAPVASKVAPGKPAAASKAVPAKAAPAKAAPVKGAPAKAAPVKAAPAKAAAKPAVKGKAPSKAAKPSKLAKPAAKPAAKKPAAKPAKKPAAKPAKKPAKQAKPAKGKKK